MAKQTLALVTQPLRPGYLLQPNNESDSNGVKQREIAPDDVCPICQEELLAKRLPVTFCRWLISKDIVDKCTHVYQMYVKLNCRHQIITCCNKAINEDLYIFTIS